MDYHCPRRDCDCTDTFIDFLRFDEERREATEVLGCVMAKPGGDWDLRPATKEGVVLRDAWRAVSDLFGDVPGELNRRRDTVRNNVERLVLEAERAVDDIRERVKTPPSLKGSSGGSRVGRNDPCPCGSGRKFKRCCGTRA
jgi:hypothetical protein